MRFSDKNVSLQEETVRCCKPVTVDFSLFQRFSHGCEKNRSSSRIVNGLFSPQFKILDRCHSFDFHELNQPGNVSGKHQICNGHSLLSIGHAQLPGKRCPRCSLTSTLITQGRWPGSDQRSNAALSWSGFLSKQQAESGIPSCFQRKARAAPRRGTLSSRIGGP